jgi:extracellular elastinolytic metalloproteinase
MVRAVAHADIEMHENPRGQSMHTFKAIIAAGLFAALTASAAMAQDQAASFNAQNANVHSGPSGQALTLPSQASAPSIVADFLRGEGLSGDTVGSLVLQSENSARTGLTHLRFEQQVDGLTVFGAYVKATVNGDGQLVHLIEALATPGNMRPAVIGPRDALDAAMAENHSGVDVTLGAASGSGNTVSFSGDDFFYRDPTATRVAIAMNDGALQEGFLVETWSGEDNLLNHTLVGANGRVLGVQLRTNNDSYKIFLDQPLSTPAQTTVDGPGNGAGNTESPSGWLLGTQTTLDISGNNVNAYLDRNNNDSSDGGGSSVEAPYNFLTNTVDPEVDPTNPDNQKVAVQNLFYFNNLIHDKLYSHGFDEAAGNFQEIISATAARAVIRSTPRPRTAAAPTTPTSPPHRTAAIRACRCISSPRPRPTVTATWIRTSSGTNTATA